MGRMHPDDRRQAIVQAAVRVVTRKGLAAATARDVAAEMGSSSGLIHHYFDSMDDVLAAAFELVAAADLDRTIGAMAGESGASEKLRAFFANYAPAEDDRTYQLWLDAWSEAARRPALRDTSLRLNEAWQQALAKVIRDGAEPGSRAAEDPDASAWRIISFLDGLALQVVAHRANISRSTALGWAIALTEHELGLESGTIGR